MAAYKLEVIRRGMIIVDGVDSLEDAEQRCKIKNEQIEQSRTDI